MRVDRAGVMCPYQAPFIDVGRATVPFGRLASGSLSQLSTPTLDKRCPPHADVLQRSTRRQGMTRGGLGAAPSGEKGNAVWKSPYSLRALRPSDVIGSLTWGSDSARARYSTLKSGLVSRRGAQGSRQLGKRERRPLGYLGFSDLKWKRSREGARRSTTGRKAGVKAVPTLAAARPAG